MSASERHSGLPPRLRTAAATPRSLLFGLLQLLAALALADTPASLPPLGIGIGGMSYWSRGLFANTMLTGHDWLEFRGSDWGSTLVSWNHPQFDASGYPKHLLPGQKLRCLMWPFSASPGQRPASWPRRDHEGQGKIVLTWRGDADIRLPGIAFLASESSGPATGRLIDGRRVYRNTSQNFPSLTVEEIHPDAPVTDIRVWLPDPTAPDTRSLEGSLWHPNALARLGDIPFGFLRFMDLGATNQSPQQDWSDRRLPSHRTQHGVLNTRSPAPGHSGNRTTGMAWELMIDLANTLDRDAWICVPHLATDEYVLQLARLIRYGSDGRTPYDAPQQRPVWRPLAPHLRVWVEFSNEIWSSGSSFPQGDWAQAEGARLGLSKAVFNARRASRIWSLFQQVFEGSERLVRVAPLFTANAAYSDAFLRELALHGPTLSPAVFPDIVSPTTYFGNGIQDWVYETALCERSSPARRWFLSAEDFTSGNAVRPVSLPASDPYWSSPKCAADLAATFAEWKRRIFSGSTAQGAGPDATGSAGGFSDDLTSRVRAILGRDLPLVSYEGGPSLYTDNRDGSDARDDGLTLFMEALNRHPAMRDLLSLHLNLATSKGLRTHAAFVDVGQWGKYGQWGHLEFPDQRPEDSPKWTALREHDADMRTLRPVGDPRGSRPRFLTDRRLPSGIGGQPYAAEILIDEGDVSSATPPRFRMIGSLLDPGLKAAVDPNDPRRFRISGRPVGNGSNYLLLRVEDADGDAAWRIFTFDIGGGQGVVFESRFEGADPARHLPWRNTFAVQPGLEFSGWSFGKGLVAQPGLDALVFSVNAPADKAQSTQELALGKGEYLEATLTPTPDAPLRLSGAVARFSVRRDSYHAPRRWALRLVIPTLDLDTEIFASPENTSEGQSMEYVATLPADTRLNSLVVTVQLRLVPFAGQYSNHPAAVTAFRLSVAGTPSGFGADVSPSSGKNRLVNLSARAVAGHNAEALVAGFTLQGAGEKRLLLRGAGPTLAGFGLSSPLSQTRLALFRGANRLMENAAWDRQPDMQEIAATTARLQAFPFPVGSLDAALLARLAPGSYTVHLSPAVPTQAPGASMLEIYDADEVPESELVNLSARAWVGPGEATLIAGFVVAGGGCKRLLLRGVGPALALHGLTQPLRDPTLGLHREATLIDSNDQWFEHPASPLLAALSNDFGAFPLPYAGLDAALLVACPPGRYTTHVKSEDGSLGFALAEVYDAP